MLAAQFLAEFVGGPIEPCATCGGPSISAPTFRVLVGDEQLGNCTTCGRPVDKHGATIVPLREDGREGDVRVIRLQPDEDHEPEMP